MVLGSLVLVIAALYWAQKVLIPVALAVMLSFILSPAVLWLQRRRVPKVAAVILVVLLVFSLLGGIGWVVYSQVRDLAAQIPQHEKTIANKIIQLQGSDDSVFKQLGKMFQDIWAEVQGNTPSEVQAPMPVVIRNETPFNLSYVPAIAAPLLELIIDIVIVVMLVVFMLLNREDLRYRLIQLVGHSRLTVTTRALDEATQRISQFLNAQLLVNCIFGVCFTTALYFLGVPYAILWGFLSAMMRFVPYLGTWMSLFFPLMLSVAIAPGWAQPLEVAAAFTVIELTTAYVCEPLLFSHSTGVSAIALLLAAAFWTWLWGPIGLLLATPLSVCMIVLGRHVPQLSFFEVMMGSEPVIAPPARFYQRLLAQDQDEATEQVEAFMRAKPRETIYDELLLPALVLARRDEEQGVLAPDYRECFYRATAEILEETVGAQVAASREVQPEFRPITILGCPARNEADQLALEMLKQTLQPAGVAVEVMSTANLSAELVARAREQGMVVCITSLPPGGIARTRYLCKRLKAEVPGVKVVVVRWGPADDWERVRTQLREAGADVVTASLNEARNELVSLARLTNPASTPEMEVAAAATV
jgi:predicted PurR-regulated permease PerM